MLSVVLMEEEQLVPVIEEAVVFGLAAVGTVVAATKALSFCDKLTQEREAAEKPESLSR